MIFNKVNIQNEKLQTHIKSIEYAKRITRTGWPVFKRKRT